MSEYLGQTALTISDIDQQLAHTTFVIVDLETAGGKPGDAGITEIGAVKVRGGEVLGEFRTFCHPGIYICANWNHKSPRGNCAKCGERSC
jgi:DNA polymerase III epsilon subunit-like protein